MNFQSYYVYLIKSINNQDITYVGYTTSFKQRLKTHNSGGSIHTSKYKPWEVVICMAF
ncbi:MAG: GIY-YIG nuclease family protein [bacterium]